MKFSGKSRELIRRELAKLPEEISRILTGEFMSISRIIPIAVTFAFLAVGSGNLPKVLKKLRVAQLELLKDSQASRWGKAWTP